MRRRLRNSILIFILAIYIASIASVNAFAGSGRKLSTFINLGSVKKVTVELVNPNKNNNKPQQTLKSQQSNRNFEQFNPPAKGEEIAILKTNAGVIKIRLLPQFAPKTVQNFINRINSGYYDGLGFNRVISNSLIQGGEANQSDPDNSDIDEYNPEVRNFRGAVSAVSNDQGKDSGQFIIVQADFNFIDKDPINYMQSSGETMFPSYVINKYKKVGGAPWLDFHNVVFGQVIQGMNVVDKISQAKVDENNKPIRDIRIMKATIAAN